MEGTPCWKWQGPLIPTYCTDEETGGEMWGPRPPWQFFPAYCWGSVFTCPWVLTIVCEHPRLLTWSLSVLQASFILHRKAST